MTAFRFNRNYKDLDQVAEFLPAFERVLAEIEAAGKYRYNDSFRGRVPGIEGPDEETAIYLLQTLERKRRQDEKVAALIDDGFRWLDEIDETARFECVVLVPPGSMDGPYEEIPRGRVVPRDGKPYGVLPKGARTHGKLIGARRVLAR